MPIVALTANALIGSDEMFLQNGFNDFVPKPIDLFRLDTVLKRWIRPEAQMPEIPLSQSLSQSSPSQSPFHWAPEETGLLDGLHADGLDIDAGIQRYADEAAYLTVLRSYALHTPELLETLRAEKRPLETTPSPSHEDLQRYIIAVHGLKGSSYGVKADAVGDAALAL